MPQLFHSTPLFIALFLSGISINLPSYTIEPEVLSTSIQNPDSAECKKIYRDFQLSLILKNQKLSKQLLQTQIRSPSTSYSRFLYYTEMGSIDSAIKHWDELPIHLKESPETFAKLFKSYLSQQFQKDLTGLTTTLIHTYGSSQMIEILPGLKNWIYSPVEDIRLAAFQTIAQYHYSEMAPTLLELFPKEKNGYLKAAIAHILANFGYIQALPALLHELEKAIHDPSSIKTISLIQSIAELAQQLLRNARAEGISTPDPLLKQLKERLSKEKKASPQLMCLNLFLSYYGILPPPTASEMVLFCQHESQEVQQFFLAYLPLFATSEKYDPKLEEMLLELANAPNFPISTLAAWSHCLLHSHNSPFNRSWWQKKLHDLPSELELQCFLLSAWMRTPEPPKLEEIPTSPLLQLNYLHYSYSVRDLTQNEKNLFYQLVKNLLKDSSHGYLRYSSGEDHYPHPYWNWLTLPLPTGFFAPIEPIKNQMRSHALLFLSLLDEMACAGVEAVDDLWLEFFHSATLYHLPADLMTPPKRISQETIDSLTQIMTSPKNPPWLQLKAAIALLWSGNEEAMGNSLGVIQSQWDQLIPAEQKFICYLLSYVKPLKALPWLCQLLPGSRSHLRLPLLSALLEISQRGS
jgi:hypothetical protein